MLRLPRFGVVAPETVDDLVEALATPGARVIAGGTDILPNLKHRLDRPPLLVSSSRIASLRQIAREPGPDGDALRIGASVTLTELSRSQLVGQLFPSLARAAGLVASPSIRNMGTIGGNIHLDTRCRYVNQTDFWRSAIGGCLKSEGDLCHVVKGGRSCVAALSSDCVPVLITLDAKVVLRSVAGERIASMAEYYQTDGVAHIKKEPGEFMTEVRVPVPTTPRRTTYAKWTVRRSIDFPLVSAAMRFDLEEDRDDAPLKDARVCIGVLAAKPRLVRRTSNLAGQRLGDESTIEALCKLVYNQCKPLDNVPYEAAYRRKMLPVYIRRAIREMLAASS